MDLCDYSRARFDEIETTFRAFLKSIGVEPGCFIPISARQGHKVAIARRQNAVVDRTDRAGGAWISSKWRRAQWDSRCAFRFRTFTGLTTAAFWRAASKRARVKVGRPPGFRADQQDQHCQDD